MLSDPNSDYIHPDETIARIRAARTPEQERDFAKSPHPSETPEYMEALRLGFHALADDEASKKCYEENHEIKETPGRNGIRALAGPEGRAFASTQAQPSSHGLMEILGSRPCNSSYDCENAA